MRLSSDETGRTSSPRSNARRQLARIACALLAAASVTACTSVVDSDMRNRDAFGGATTWAPLVEHPSLAAAVQSAGQQASLRVQSPGRDASGIDRAIERLIEQQMAARGYRRAEATGDVYVHHRLVLEPRIESVKVPLAARTVHSFSDQPTYTVEGSTIEQRVREHLRLDVDVRSPSGEILWSGRLETVLERERDVPLAEIVDRVMRPVPERSR